MVDMQPVGYAYDADVHCEDCAVARFGASIRTTCEGLEDSEGNEPGAIFADSESDTPEHCGDCGAFLGTALTADGYAYVVDALARADGNVNVLQDWWEEYSDSFDAEDWETLAGAWVGRILASTVNPDQTTMGG